MAGSQSEGIAEGPDAGCCAGCRCFVSRDGGKSFIGIDALYKSAVAAKQRADVAVGVLQGLRLWIASLPNNSKMVLIHPTGDPAELPALVKKLAGLRNELESVNRTIVPSDNIAAMVRDYVAGLGTRPHIALVGAGEQQQIQCRWPDDSNALSIVAMLQGDLLASFITKTIKDAHPQTRAQVQARRDELVNQIDELSYVVACLLCKSGGLPDARMEARHVLGVRLAENTEKQIAV